VSLDQQLAADLFGVQVHRADAAEQLQRAVEEHAGRDRDRDHLSPPELPPAILATTCSGGRRRTRPSPTPRATRAPSEWTRCRAPSSLLHFRAEAILRNRVSTTARRPN